MKLKQEKADDDEQGRDLDIAQFLVGGIAMYIYSQCNTILDTVLLMCDLSVILIQLQYVSNKIHGEVD
jgi:hypothetical protein